MLFRSECTDEEEEEEFVVVVEGDDETACMSVILCDDETEAVKRLTSISLLLSSFSIL
jgi:hypothetical protein